MLENEPGSRAHFKLSAVGGDTNRSGQPWVVSPPPTSSKAIRQFEIHSRNNPLVTIGIPNYNYAHYIIEAIESAVNQDYSNIELIIVDDCSTDNSREVIEEWIKNYKGPVPVKFIKNENNLGLSGTCNVILKNVSGKYYQTLDADDVLYLDKISQQIEILKLNENAALIYSNACVIDENSIKTEDDYLKRINYKEKEMPQGNIFKQLFDFNFIPLPSVLINATLARQVGGYDDSMQVQDYYLWLKLAENFPVIYLPGKTALYRVHPKSMSNNEKSNARSIDSVLRIKYSYYQKVNAGIQKIIKKNIHFSTVIFYKHKYPSAAYWLKRDLILNPGIKSFMYFIAYNLGVPFGFFSFLKKIFRGK
ncbi:MAG TPA: glycosyltransferase [Hanamia sp.]|nr:glycosyltransferase [Hanamia sp.]